MREKKWITQFSEAEGDKAGKCCENGVIILGFHRGKIFHNGKSRRENSNFICHLGYNVAIKTFNNEKHFKTIAKRETNITELSGGKGAICARKTNDSFYCISIRLWVQYATTDIVGKFNSLTRSARKKLPRCIHNTSFFVSFFQRGLPAFCGTGSPYR